MLASNTGCKEWAGKDTTRLSRTIGVSGAQGSGKTTLLGELQSRGIPVDSYKVSRAVQDELGWKTLDRVRESPSVMMDFQHKVLDAKFKHDVQLAESEKLVLVERTFADINAYTSQWAWDFVDSGDMSIDQAISFMTGFTDRCARCQRMVYAGVILLPYMPDVILWEDDPNRAGRLTVDSVFENVQIFVERKCHDRPSLTITASSVTDRADQVIAFLESLK